MRIREIAALCLTACLVPASAEETNRVHTSFRETDTLFANPGQGWMSQARTPVGEPRFPCSVVYIRFNWEEIEPQEGHYEWKLIDDVIAAWKPRGATVAMRVMTANAHSGGYYTSPKWLFDAGCKSHEYTVGGDDPTSGGKRIVRIEPDYSDPLYLEKHGAFLKALGARYDGRPEVEFLDIGSYGIWGEWHTKNPAPVEVRKKIVDLYRNAFRKTPLVFMSDDAEVLYYAISLGAGFRRDGVASPWHEENWIGSEKYAGVQGMADVWKHAPVVFEWFGDYDYIQSKNWSFERAVDFMLNNHVSLINDNIGKVPPAAMPQLEKLARLAGARFVLREISHEGTVGSGGRLNLRMKWSNAGTGVLHRPFRLRLMLLDAEGNPAAGVDGRSDPRAWLPGDFDLTESLPLPSGLKAGDYKLALELVEPGALKPRFKLAIDAPEKDGVYEIGKVAVER